MKNRPFDRLRERLPLLTVILCTLQPVLDVISFWQLRLGVSNYFTMTARILLLLCMVLLGALVSDKRRHYLLAAGVILLYLGGHAIACIQNEGGYLNAAEDLTDQLRTLVMPLTALCMITFLRQNRAVFPVLLRAMACNLAIILLIELVSVISGTDPHTYEAKGIGVRGWFVWTSCQSAILSVLAPVSIVWTLKRFEGRLLPLCVTCLLAFGALYAFGTRLAYLSLAAVGFGMALSLLLCGKEHRRQALAVGLCAVLFLALYPISPMVRNRTAVNANAAIKQERVSAAAAEYGVSIEARTTTDPDALQAAYRYNLQGMVDRFGIERVAQQYGYTLDADKICDDRYRKIQFCELLAQQSAESSPLTRWFGLELARTRQTTEVYVFETDSWELDSEPNDPENDFLGLYYLNGIVGLCLIFGFVLFIALRAVLRLLREPKRLFSPEFAAFAIAGCLALAYACTTASMLRRNNASFYFALILAALWHLTRRPEQKNG